MDEPKWTKMHSHRGNRGQFYWIIKHTDYIDECVVRRTNFRKIKEEYSDTTALVDH